MAESFTPPEAVASAARRGLRLREKVKAGTDVGVARARDLSNRRPVSLKTIASMVGFFARFEAQRPANVGTDASPTPWLVAWLLWGGDPGREWSASVWRRHGSEERAREMGLTRQGEAVALSREAPPPPAPFPNAKGLHVGRPFRTLTSGEPVRDGSSGQALGVLSVEDLEAMVTVFERRRELGEGAPRIDFNHGPSRGLLPDTFGEVLSLYVADDGERGPGLYVVPGWTDHGRDFVARHQTPDGDSLLSNSPEFYTGPTFRRGGPDVSEDGVGEYLGAAELLGVALTPTPQQSEDNIDSVRLSRGAQRLAAPAAEEVVQMDAEQTPSAGDGRIDALEAKLDELRALLAQVVERQDKASEIAEEAVAEAVDEGLSEITQAVEEAKAEMDDAEAALSAEEREELAAGASPAEALALSASKATPAKLRALAARTARAKALSASRTVAQRLAALEAENVAAKVDAERVALRAAGVSAGDAEGYLKSFKRKLTQPQAWAALHGADCPVVSARAGLLANAKAAPGALGVKADTESAGASAFEQMQAWCRSNKVDFNANPSAASRQWARATGRHLSEVI